MTADELIAYWSCMKGGNIHPDDVPYIDRMKFETHLHPVPWVGPLKTAKVYLLFLNPWLSQDDVDYEKSNPEFITILRNNIQDGLQPYFYLLERFNDHPGYRWARRIFGSDIGESQTDRFCIIQLVPYHSREGAAARALARKLPSTIAAREFVQKTPIPRVLDRQIGLVVARSTKLWLGEHDAEGESLIIYKGGECRAAFQTKGTRGGRLLRDLLRAG